jgi:Zn-dependent protease
MSWDRGDEYEVVEPQYTYRYTTTPYGSPQVRKRPGFFSREELKHILIAVSVLILAFTFVLSGLSVDDMVRNLPMAVLAVLAGFFLHEMAHKVLARRYGCWAEFRADFKGLALALVISVFGFLFAAPGAVYISGNVTREQNGRISLAGPAANLAIALGCLPVMMMTSVPVVVSDIAFSLYFFSTFLAIFNLLPFYPLDGSKVWAWNKPIYIAAMAASALLFALVML